MERMIETRNLTKRFGKFTAVDKVSLSVNRGEIYGFLGLNGAGKTTTIRMLLGMIRPSSGEIYLKEKKINSGSYKSWNDVGYLVEIPFSYPDLTVRENLEMFRRLRFIQDPQAVDRVMEKLQLLPYRDRLAKNLSLGNSQRLGIAKAILHHPEILILDEPANGLDPAGIVEIREMLLDLALNHGVTIFISSHILGEISRIATRVGIIHEGRLIQEMNTDRLEQLRRKRLLVNARKQEAVKIKLNEAGYSVKLTDEGYFESHDEKALQHPEEIARLLVLADLPPTLLQVEEEDLESYFLRIIGVNNNS